MAVIDHHRLAKLFLQALALYLATSLVQLEAKQSSWPERVSFSFAEVPSLVLKRVQEIGRAEENEVYMFAPGN